MCQQAQFSKINTGTKKQDSTTKQMVYQRTTKLFMGIKRQKHKIKLKMGKKIRRNETKQ